MIKPCFSSTLQQKQRPTLKVSRCQTGLYAFCVAIYIIFLKSEKLVERSPEKSHPPGDEGPPYTARLHVIIVPIFVVIPVIIVIIRPI
jgi:hypothetical protein